MVGGVYKQWYLTFIEVMFISNLGILSATSLYNISSDSSIIPITYTSVGIAFALFIVISFFYLIIKLTQSRNGKLLVAFVRDKLQRKQINEEDEVVMIPADEAITQVTYSEVNLEKSINSSVM